tara:strand:+ start:141 stop:719 length:579 start_codon:yes stop_codon:yes gene_type:complete
MGYVRCDENCLQKPVQPDQINVLDTFGNSNDFFHTGYARCDENCVSRPIEFDPNNPQNNIRDTNSYVLFFDTNWTRHLSDNTPGTKSKYSESLYFPEGGTFPPGHPDVGSGTYIVKSTDTYSPTDDLVDVFICDENDREVLISNEAGDAYFSIYFSEYVSTEQDPNLLVSNESGDSLVAQVDYGESITLNND